MCRLSAGYMRRLVQSFSKGETWPRIKLSLSIDGNLKSTQKSTALSDMFILVLTLSNGDSQENWLKKLL